ncbi:Tfs1 protein [Saccharomycopsis crataegensis]|uniref:Tfs1 protein n=1 Tax=Saccharomycopsis crataegensis TaxID=43959 RepID=A0AAV5QGK4_9ASCO|nr:Tfs1 protein [Saccharomycopsis crataegensis]
MLAHNLVTISSSIVDALKKHELFPEVLDEFTPQGLLTISYGKDLDVLLGNQLKVKDTQTLPKIQLTLDIGDDELVSTFSALDYFTLVVTDPDAPSRTDKKWSEYCHYIKTNIKLTQSDGAKNSDFLSAQLDLNEGPDYLKYEGPGPPPKTGKHRYCFFLFKQKAEINPPPLTGRPNWGLGKPATGVREWSTKYGLEPIAANFFYAQNETQ